MSYGLRQGGRCLACSGARIYRSFGSADFRTEGLKLRTKVAVLVIGCLESAIELFLLGYYFRTKSTYFVNHGLRRRSSLVRSRYYSKRPPLTLRVNES
jgi:lysine/ornithine N-monooxygenase